jgi:hypothetical protein
MTRAQAIEKYKLEVLKCADLNGSRANSIRKRIAELYALTDAEYAAERKRKRRNSDARARYDAMRSLGLVKTPYGWE